MTVYIYGLFDPRNLQLRYIGKSDDPKRRFRTHLSHTRLGKNSHVNNWIKQLLNEDLTPSMEILEECDESDWQEIEKAWIKECREKGLKLTNMDDGGYGFESGKNNLMYGSNRTGDKNPMFGRHHSEETKELIRKRVVACYSDKTKTPWYGKTLSKKHKEKISRANSGRTFSDKRKQHYSVIFSGENNPMYGKTHNEIARKKIGVCSLLWHAHKRNETNLICELQEQYLELYGEYNSKYPHR